jgi:branched-chain amino acid transport system substrate-binding protein
VASLRRGRWSTVGGVVALAVVVAACSSSSKSSSSGSTSATSSVGSASSASPSSAQASAAPIKVGFICSCSGSPFGAFNVPAEDEYKAWANTVNAGGGINGHQVQLIVKDDANNPGTSVTDIQSLISDHVVAIADTSNFDEAWANTVQAANIPIVGGYSSGVPFGTNPDFYPEGQTNDSAILAVLTTAKNAGATNLANVYCAESPICAESVPAFTATGKTLGIPVVYNAEISATAPNYTAQCVAADQKGVKSVFIGDASAIIVRVATDCSQQSYTPIYVQEEGGFGLNEASAPGLKNTLWLESPTLPYFATNNPAVQAANAAMDKYYPGIRENNNLFVHDAFTLWVSGQLLADAIKAGGLTAGAAPSAAEVVTGLQSLKGDTLGGLTSPLTFTPGKGHTVDCWFTARIQNSVATVENNGQSTCENGA